MVGFGNQISSLEARLENRQLEKGINRKGFLDKMRLAVRRLDYRQTKRANLSQLKARENRATRSFDTRGGVWRGGRADARAPREPRQRPDKLHTAHSRLHRNRSSQINPYVTVAEFFENFKMFTLLHSSKLKKLAYCFFLFFSSFFFKRPTTASIEKVKQRRKNNNFKRCRRMCQTAEPAALRGLERNRWLHNQKKNDAGSDARKYKAGLASFVPLAGAGRIKKNPRMVTLLSHGILQQQLTS